MLPLVDLVRLGRQVFAFALIPGNSKFHLTEAMTLRHGEMFIQNRQKAIPVGFHPPI